MTNQEFKQSAQKVIDFKLNAIKHGVRRVYRMSGKNISSSWVNDLSPKVMAEIKSILNLSNGNYSIHSVACAAMNGGRVEAKSL